MLTKSESLDQLAAALAAAQRSMRPVAFDAVNPHFQSRYASLAAIVEALREPLAANGLAVSQVVDYDGETPVLETILLHTSGQYLAGRYPLRPARGVTPQDYGSALTYARRYALAAICGAVADDDDDGNAASRAARRVRTAQDAHKSPEPTPTTPVAHRAPVGASQATTGDAEHEQAFDALPGHEKSVYQPGNGHTAPTRPAWRTQAEAQDWAMTTGAFDHRRHCENAYDKLRRAYTAETPQPTAAGMFDRWHQDVLRRVAERHAQLDAAAAAQERPAF